jgi:hypothetical protein
VPEGFGDDAELGDTARPDFAQASIAENDKELAI